MATKEETQKIIFPYLTHPGRRYGLERDIQFPEDCIEILRSRPFSFQARSCNKWALGRVILAGDAAHVFPPFGGQGIASGFRDALGLAWRLALLHAEPEIDHVEVLKTWYMERKQQFERSLAATIRNGELVNESNAFKAFARDWFFWIIQLSPNWRRELEKGSRAEGMTRYKHQSGLPFSSEKHGGRQLPQVYVKDLKSEKIHFSDDLIFAPQKKGLFQLLLIPGSTEEATDLMLAVKAVQSNSFISMDEATVIVQSLNPVSIPKQEVLFQSTSVGRVASGEEFGADPVLCRNRPKPKYYDPSRMLRELSSAKFVIVRPDRFVYATCETQEELSKILNGMSNILLPSKL